MTEAARGRAFETLPFDGRDIVEVFGESALRRIVLPILGIDHRFREVKSLGTAFCVSSDPPVLMTAWHVVEGYIHSRRAALEKGQASLMAVLELGATLADGVTDQGGPIPVYRAIHHRASRVQPGTEWMGPLEDDRAAFRSDIALLVLPLVTTETGKLFRPNQVGIGFGMPAAAEWAYAFGYRKHEGTMDVDGDGLDFHRELVGTSGHVVQPLPKGSPDDPYVNGPSFEANLPMPSGMSGGPVLTDDQNVCAAVSIAWDLPDGSWKSHAVSLAAALELPVYEEDGAHSITLRHLVAQGSVLTVGDIPPDPGTRVDAEVFTFGLAGTPRTHARDF